MGIINYNSVACNIQGKIGMEMSSCTLTHYRDFFTVCCMLHNSANNYSNQYQGKNNNGAQDLRDMRQSSETRRN